MDIVVDIDRLRTIAQAFARRMYGENDPRRAQCEQRFFHQEYMNMITPPQPTTLERVEALLIEIRDLLKGDV
jgi:hypothetical protein